RVEVLKGPQGTLYGGSSEGGTIRYITPKPRLDHFSGATRAEVSTYGHGELGNEVAAAFGGPLIKDTLAIRLRRIRHKNRCWLDVVSAFDNHTIKKNANSTVDWAARGSLLWRVGDGFEAQLSAYHVDNWLEGGPGSQTALYLPDRSRAPASQTFTT